VAFSSQTGNFLGIFPRKLLCYENLSVPLLVFPYLILRARWLNLFLYRAGETLSNLAEISPSNRFSVRPCQLGKQRSAVTRSAHTA